MSHYVVGVIHYKGQDVDDLLAPYSENLDVPPYIVYTKEEAIRYAKEHWNEEFLKDKSDEYLWTEMAEDYDKTDEDGNIYSTYNPRSKWDWYQIGGRWSNMLKLKGSGRCVDEARMIDIDFTVDPKTYEDALRYWDVIVEGAEKKPGEELYSFYNENYYRECYGDRETYASLTSAFSTFAVITPDGEWHEKGKMGWWGISSDTPEEARAWLAEYKSRFLSCADDPNLIFTIVDCHI